MKLVVMGRDGILCLQREGGLASPDDWEPLPGALDALARLNHAGFQVALAAHWPQLAQGQLSMATLNAIHARMNRQLAAVGGRVDAIFFCPHPQASDCDCRAPRPGLLQQIGARYKIALAQVHVVASNVADAQAAHAAGCVTHRVLDGLQEPPQDEPLSQGYPPATHLHTNLAAFAAALLGQAAPEPAPAA